MRPLTKDQIRSPKRDAEPVSLPEYSAPLLVARPSAALAIRVREKKVDLNTAEGVGAMLADMLVDEEGARMLTPENVATFLDDISADALKLIADKCFAMFSPKASAPVPQKPSTSA